MFTSANWSASGTIKRVGLQEFMRMGMPVWIFLYCAAFNWSYVTWISPVWGYSGLTHKPASTSLMIVGYFLAAALSLLSPLRITRPSQTIYWCLFLAVYVPSLFVPLYVQLDDGQTLLLIQLGMTSGMLLIALSYRIRLLALRRYRLNRNLFWWGFWIFFLVLNITLFVVYRNNLRFASLADVYKVRSGAKKITEGSAWVGYVSTALSNVLNPFLITYGLSTKKKSLIGAGVAGQVLVYMAAAMKSVLFSLLLIPVFFYSLKKEKGAWVPWMAVFLSAVFLFLSTAAKTTGEGLLFNVSTITLVRTFALPGLFIGQYQYFFENFPHTYLGHVTGISWLIPSPYQLPTGIQIALFYQGNSGTSDQLVNSNANFFAMDGIVGFGLIGLPFMGLLCSLVFWIIDSCSRRFSIAFCAAALMMCTVSLTNSSLFTTLLGGGMALWMMLFLVMPNEDGLPEYAPYHPQSYS
jgi:hypothetical protein